MHDPETKPARTRCGVGTGFRKRSCSNGHIFYAWPGLKCFLIGLNTCDIAAPLTGVLTHPRVNLCADHALPYSKAHTREALNNGGEMPPGYFSRDDRRGIVRVAA